MAVRLAGGDAGAAERRRRAGVGSAGRRVGRPGASGADGGGGWDEEAEGDEGDEKLSDNLLILTLTGAHSPSKPRKY